MPLVVQKYGGTSVGSLDHLRNVAKHISDTVATGHRVIVTISAMGEQTDDLLGMALALNRKPPRRELDMLLTAGERISAALLAIALADRQVPSVSLTGSQCGILTDETHGNARITAILGDRVRAGLAEDKVVIVAGFQGVTPRTKEITTLGRGGTDLSAIAMAAALKADCCQLYKDVDGVFTADPRVVPGASVKPRLSWDAMTSLAWSGASVLHPRGAHLAAKFNIPFEIRSSLALDRPGTLVSGHESEFGSMESPRVDALAHKMNMALLECRIPEAGEKARAMIAKSLAWLWQHGEAPLVCSQMVDDNGTVHLVQLLKANMIDDYLQMLRDEAPGSEVLKRRSQLASVSIVGAGFQQSPETAAAVCQALEALPVLIDTRNTVITICIPEKELPAALSKLHTRLLPGPP